MATLRFARSLAHVETIPQQDSAERALNKLARTFVTQKEALKRYRAGGEQKVTVQHVSVGEGGQAIVGNVTQSAREGTPEQPANPTPALTDSRQPATTDVGKREGAPVALWSKRKKDDGKHRRNTAPMLSSPRCGAKTRSGKPCLSPAVSEKKRCRCMAAHLDRALHAVINMR